MEAALARRADVAVCWAAFPSRPTMRLVAAGLRLRRLHDIEAAALATATVLLDRPDPLSFAVARPRVGAGAASVTLASGARLAVPEYARALLRAWAGRDLLPGVWADDVAATYLTLRLELAARHTGLELVAPSMATPAPVAWHRRSDPGAQVLARLTGSAGYDQDRREPVSAW